MIILDPDLADCTQPERAMWGMVHYLATGIWQPYGVMPPPGVDCPCPDLINTAYLGELLGISTAHADALWVGLVSKGAINVQTYDACSCGCGCEPDGDWHWSQQPWCPCVRQDCACVTDGGGR